MLPFEIKKHDSSWQDHKNHNIPKAMLAVNKGHTRYYVHAKNSGNEVKGQDNDRKNS